jgi:hypothetical protein
MVLKDRRARGIRQDNTRHAPKHLPHKHEALSSNPSTTERKREERQSSEKLRTGENLEVSRGERV